VNGKKAASRIKIKTPNKRHLPNRMSEVRTVEEEQAIRQSDAERLAKVCAFVFPGMKGDMERIDDPRQPGKTRHPLCSVLLYGVFAFMLCVGSRREINRILSTPVAATNLRAVSGIIHAAPHSDTLARVLKGIDAEEVQGCYAKLLKRLLKLKEFRAMAVPDKKFVVAVDGSMKYSREYEFSDRAIHRRVGEAGKEMYGVYVLEAVPVLADGSALPLLTEFVENCPLGNDSDKQDCEINAYKRMAPKLAALLGRNVTILADSLYAAGPVISLCEKYGWGYAITLKQGAMPTVWEEAAGLMKADPANALFVEYGDRRQDLRWANGVEYTYGNNHKRLSLNVAMLDERWEEPHLRSGNVKKNRHSRYAWIMSPHVSRENIFKLCNGIARKRWTIENEFKAEKHDGLMFGHCFSLDRSASKGFHYLMKIGRALTVIAACCALFADIARDKGFMGFVSYLRLIVTGSVLDPEAVRSAAAAPFRLRMNPDIPPPIA
jgi:hypothetical protein